MTRSGPCPPPHISYLGASDMVLLEHTCFLFAYFYHLILWLTGLSRFSSLLGPSRLDKNACGMDLPEYPAVTWVESHSKQRSASRKHLMSRDILIGLLRSLSQKPLWWKNPTTHMCCNCNPCNSNCNCSYRPAALNLGLWSDQYGSLPTLSIPKV